MKQRIILLFAFSVICMKSIGQTFSKGELAFSLSGGSSRPMGGFAGKDMASSLIYRYDVSNPWVIGIDKSQNGFSQSGHYYAAQVSYGLSSRFFTFLRVGNSNNPVAKMVIENFFIDLWSNDYEFQHSDYQIMTLTPGIGYSFQLGSWGLNTGLFVGYGRSTFPYYRMILNFTPSRLNWGYVGPKPDLNALAYGGMFNFSYKIKRIRTGLEILYQRADFDHTFTTYTLIPGGNANPEYHDTIKSSLLFVGLQVSYSIVKGKSAGR